MGNRFSMVNLISEKCLNKLLVDIQKQDYRVLEIKGEDIFDAKAFFKIVKDVLPLDPPISGKINWDAFSDSLCEGILNLGDRKVAIIWSKADNMLEHGLADLIDAVRCLTDVSTSLYNDVEEVERTSLIIFLAGEGKNFPVLYN